MADIAAMTRARAQAERHCGDGRSSGRAMADAIRSLAVDAIEAAGSGQYGMPTGMADAATMLWTRALKYDAADPRWPDRDRFVLSAGHGSMLLYALLCLTGHDGMDIDALRRHRKLHSPAAAHPEHGEHAAIEATTGPLGQGIATAVGMALAERMMAARFGRSLVDHRTWVVASDGDLMEGLSHEAICLAGHLRLTKLAVLYHDSGMGDGGLDLACSADQLKRFAAHGWAVKAVDGYDQPAVAAALSFAIRSRRPTLIACRTRPHRRARGRFGAAEAEAARLAYDLTEPPFSVPEPVAQRWRVAGSRGASARRAWLKRLAHHPMRAEYERVIAGRLPDGWHEALAAIKARFAQPGPEQATRQSSLSVLEALAPAIPELIGGSADLATPTLTLAPCMAAVQPGSYAGRYVHYGVREHAMAAAMNGMALHGGLIPYGGTFLAFSDYMRPALRLAAQMGSRVIHVLTHDSIGLGEDGPTHQPVEHLASLRAMPNLHVFRPADAIETAECWELALRRASGPSLLVLSRQDLPALRREVGRTESGENACARGGYLLAGGPDRHVTLIATGSELHLAIAARATLAERGTLAAVVALPCWELFSAQDEAYRARVLGAAPRFGIEAACGFGWERWLGEDGVFIGMTGFGASAPAGDLYRHFGITAEAVVTAVRKRLDR